MSRLQELLNWSAMLSQDNDFDGLIGPDDP